MIDATQLDHNMGRHRDHPRLLACTDCANHWMHVFAVTITLGGFIGGLAALIA